MHELSPGAVSHCFKRARGVTQGWPAPPSRQIFRAAWSAAAQNTGLLGKHPLLSPLSLQKQIVDLGTPAPSLGLSLGPAGCVCELEDANYLIKLDDLTKTCALDRNPLLTPTTPSRILLSGLSPGWRARGV
jgi:hypothetical protein